MDSQAALYLPSVVPVVMRHSLGPQPTGVCHVAPSPGLLRLRGKEIVDLRERMQQIVPWKLPEGSKWRLPRFKEGKHPEGKVAADGPDVRAASNIIKVRTHSRHGVQDFCFCDNKCVPKRRAVLVVLSRSSANANAIIPGRSIWYRAGSLSGCIASN